MPVLALGPIAKGLRSPKPPLKLRLALTLDDIAR
ncbi:hypothetical protein [Synechococcus sp. 7002]